MADLGATPSSLSRSRVEEGLARLLRLSSVVHGREVAVVLLLSANICLLLTTFYVLKTIREPLILTSGTQYFRGSELKIYASAVQTLLLFGVVPLYSWVAGRTSRVRLITGTLTVFLVSLLAFAALMVLEVGIGFAFYLWLGIFGVTAVAQFWSFANDLFSQKQGERLFPVIAMGGTVGAIVGAWLAGQLIGVLGIGALMLVAAAILAACASLFVVTHRHGRGVREQDEPIAKDEDCERPVVGAGGFRLVWGSRYLWLIALVTLLANFVNTQGEFILADTVKNHAVALIPEPAGAGHEMLDDILERRRALIGETYGEFYGLVNALTFAVQMFLVSRVFRWLGVGGAVAVLPVVAFGAYGLIALLPGLAIARAGKIIENGVDYSLQNTTRQALFLPTSREVKYKAKAAIDTFFVRFGDTAAALLVFAGLHVFGFTVRHFALTNVVLAVVWLVTGLGITRLHRGLSGRPAQRHPVILK